MTNTNTNTNTNANESYLAYRVPASPKAGEVFGTPSARGGIGVDAGTPWLLNSHDHYWVVDAGRVDIFVVNKVTGRRIALGSLIPSDVFGGAHESHDENWQTIALGVLGTEVTRLGDPGSERPNVDWIELAFAALAEERQLDDIRLRQLALNDTAMIAEANSLVTQVALNRSSNLSHAGETLASVSVLAKFDGLAEPQIKDYADGSAFDRVQEVAQTIPARARAVKLESSWWKKSVDGFITVDQAGALVTVLPLKNLSLGRRVEPRYEIYRDGIPQALTQEIARELSLDAMVLQPITPSQPMALRGLLAATRQQLRAEVFWMFILAFASALVALLVPITLGAVVNSAVPNRSTSQVTGLITLLVAAAFAAFIFDLVRNLAVLRVGSELDRTLLPAIWDRVLRLPVRFFREHEAGSLAARVAAVDSARQVVSDAFVIGAVSVIFAFVNLVLISLVAPQFLLVTILVLLVYGVIVFFVTRRAIRAEHDAFQAGMKRDSMSLQLLRGISKIRVAGATATMYARWVHLLSATSSAQQQRSLNTGFIGVASGSLALIASALAYLIAIIGGATVPLGTFVVFAVSLTLAVSAATSIATLSASLGFARVSIQGIRPVLAAETEDRVAGARVELDGRVSFQDLYFRYDEVPVLNGFSLEIPAGSFTALVGASGCGKSTVLRCLLGFETLERGSILLSDQPVADLDLTYVRRQFGVVPQKLTILGGTILENILGSRALTEDDAWLAAERVGLGDFIRGLPMGMQTLLVDGGSTLSGGQLQRLMLARAIAGEPKLILLDEATSALDNPTQKLVTDSLNRMSVTRIVVAHRLSTVLDADQIAVMHQGRVVELGTHQELMLLNGVYADLVKRQL